MASSRSPRPILKKTPWTTMTTTSSASTTPALPFARCRQLQPTPSLFSPHVHFPPTPVLSSSQTTHSATLYDRHPIDVSPNGCQLPERGCRVYLCDGNDYDDDNGLHCGRTQSPKGSYFHPRAFEACQTEPDDEVVVPTAQLVPPHFLEPPPLDACPGLSPDLSSTESSSDDLDSPSPPNIIPSSRPSYLLARTCSQEEFDRALLFLPHPPTPGGPKGRSSSLKKRRTTQRIYHPLKSVEGDSDDMLIHLQNQQSLDDEGFASPDSCLDGF